MDVAAFLKEVEVFQGIGEENAGHLASRVEERTFAAGAQILRRGERGDCMFVIFSGEVQIPILDKEGRPRFVAQLGRGQFFGEMALLTGEPRTADVFTSGGCHCLALSHSTVEELMYKHPEVARFLTAILGQRLMSTGGIQQVGKYRLVGELGRGGIALVYEGIHPTLERPVAIKMLFHELVYHSHFAERFRNEARIIAQLRHPNIVEVFDTEEAYATFFIVMEKVTGTDLSQAIQERGLLPPAEVRAILLQIASALELAHKQGIIHRDVKPSNVLISRDGVAKLGDFGLALVPQVEEKLDVDHRKSLGTPTYMAPEQIKGYELDHRIDIYALGVMAYEMLWGTPPFVGEVRRVLRQHLQKPLPALQELNPNIPADLAQFVARATAKRREDRFQSCAEIIEFFEGIRQQEGWKENLRVRTLTFVYEPRHEEEATEVINKIKKGVREIKWLLVR